MRYDPWTGPPPDCLDLDGLPLRDRLLLLIRKHGPSPENGLTFWAGHRTTLACRRLVADDLAAGPFALRDGLWRLTPSGVALAAALEAARGAK